MKDPDMHVLWVEGQEWIVKRVDHQYFYRPEGDYGIWKKGTLPGLSKSDMDLIFHTNQNEARGVPWEKTNNKKNGGPALVQHRASKEAEREKLPVDQFHLPFQKANRTYANYPLWFKKNLV